MKLPIKLCCLLLIFIGLFSCAPSNWDPEINAVMRHRKRSHIRAAIRGSSKIILKNRSTINSFTNPVDVDMDDSDSIDTVAPIVLRDNARVRKFVKLYTGKRKKDLQVPLKRYAKYRYLVEKVLDYYDLPQELSNVAIVESKFDTEAVSPKGAVGIWQFMKPTAKNLGLRCSFWQDERKDVLKSTIAAAKYLTELNDRFDDWLLALAAYNAGPNRVANAIEKAGGERDFYKLAALNLLPRETVNHVSKFIAITMITKNPDLYQMPLGNQEILGDRPLVD